MFRIFAFTLLFVLPTTLAAESYKCTTTNFGRGGWVPKEMILAFDTAADAGSAYDPFIHHIHKAPIPVSFERRSETSYTFRWTLEGLKASNGGKGKNSFKVTLFADRNQFTLSGRRHGYDNVISASGTCQRIR